MIGTTSEKYKWVICLTCMLVLFSTGGLLVTGFNVYSSYLVGIGGLNNTELSLIIMTRNLFNLLSMFGVVRMMRKFDLRITLLVALIFAIAAFLVFSISGSFIMYFAGMCLAGMSYGLGGMVPVSVLIRRWFDKDDGLALGICAAGTGLSGVIGAPVITAVIESSSMGAAFRMEAAFLTVIAIISVLLIRDYPSLAKQQEVYEARKKKTATRGRYKIFKISTGRKYLLLTGVFLSGISYHTSPFLSVLFVEKHFDNITVSYLLSVMGIALCIGKMLYGIAADHLGKFRAGNIFYIFYSAATFMCALCPDQNRLTAFSAMVLLGLGFPMLSVGLSELAAGTAREEYFADAVRLFQIIYMLGSIAVGPFPGIMADMAGGYAYVYLLLGFITVAAAVLQQGMLHLAE